MTSFDQLDQLVASIDLARENFLNATRDLTDDQANHKLGDDQWSIAQITEHLVWAEMIGINGMSKAISGMRNNQPIWQGISKNEGLSIEEVVEHTWQEKEIAPQVAEPKWGGTLSFWRSALKSNHDVLVDLRKEITGPGLLKAIYPHPLSGPLDIVQRLHFLRFHLDRHGRQVAGIKGHLHFPK